MLILLHSSKTMRSATEGTHGETTTPLLAEKAKELGRYMQSLSVEQIMTAMAISRPLAEKTHIILQAWSMDTGGTSAIDAFLGDIYSGLQAASLSSEDRVYAQEHLLILSGLYGVLRPMDAVRPYRLEMGYKLPGSIGDAQKVGDTSLYKYWGDSIAKVLPKDPIIVNVSAVEYTKAVLPYCKESRIITPKFLTVSPKTNEPTFVTVHTKIARGAFARWMIQSRIDSPEALQGFNELGYRYDARLSSEDEPVFVANTFQGLGLSVRLTDS